LDIPLDFYLYIIGIGAPLQVGYFTLKFFFLQAHTNLFAIYAGSSAEPWPWKGIFTFLKPVITLPSLGYPWL
jgi:hypothetical protein